MRKFLKGLFGKKEVKQVKYSDINIKGKKEDKTIINYKVKDLIKNKQQIINSRKNDIKIKVKELESIGFGEGLMKFRPITAAEWVEVQDLKGDADKELIFRTCVEPNFKDEELLKAYLEEDQEGSDIVNYFLYPGTQTAICGMILKESNLYATDETVCLLDNDIKN